jgi:dTDP-4-amino-4,6-dideoxygalactose transaminase
VGLGQLRRLPQFNAKRARLAEHYTQLFRDVPEVEIPTIRPEVQTNWHLYVIRLRDAGIPRDDFITELRKRNVGTSVHYYPVHYHPYYRETFGFKTGDYPVCEAEFERIISLPLFPLMEADDVERVVDAVKAVISEHR